MDLSINAEKNQHPYEYYGNVFEEKNSKGYFLLRNALAYVVDSYDPILNSVEQSHFEDLGYNEVVNFNVNSKVLDLTWMKKNDVFLIENNEQYDKLESIRVNIDNLFCSYLPKSYGFKKSLILNCKYSNLNFFKQYKVFKLFMDKNYNSFSNISFEGLNPTFQILFSNYFKSLYSKSKVKTLNLKRF